MIAITHCSGAQCCRIRAGIGLGECETASQLSAGQVGQITSLLLVRAVGNQSFRAYACVSANAGPKCHRALRQLHRCHHQLFSGHACTAIRGRNRITEQTISGHFCYDLGRHFILCGHTCFVRDEARAYKVAQFVDEAFKTFRILDHVFFLQTLPVAPGSGMNVEKNVAKNDMCFAMLANAWWRGCLSHIAKLLAFNWSNAFKLDAL